MQPSQPQPNNPTDLLQPESAGTIISGLSGNELYCVGVIGYTPGNILVGNSVFSLGFVGSIGSSIRTAIGGEIKQITEIISEGRRLSMERFESELSAKPGSAATGVTSELIFHPGNIEFLSVGSTIHPAAGSGNAFTSSADGQELFCQVDAGYAPRKFVFGNVAYSIGIAKGVLGAIRQLAKGEVKEYSDIFNTTRNLALERIIAEAKTVGANSVIGVRTSIMPVGVSGVQEMVMIGTASHHPRLDGLAPEGVVTSDLTAEETWNVARMGYAPVRLVLGTSVYSLGLVGGIAAALRNFVKGEITGLTELIYAAREESLRKVQDQANAVGADMVLGTKTYIYNLGNGVIEFLAIGTAVKRVDGIAPRSEQLPPQAIIRDKDTFVNTAELSFGLNLQQT